MDLSSYSEQNADAWDEFVGRSLTGTFLHTRRYLAYHGDRFTDASVVIKDDGGNVVGLFPAALDLSNPHLAVSHPGITYGGVLHAGDLRGTRMIEAFSELKKYYSEQNFAALRYKAVPAIYHSAPAADDLYALFVNDAKRYRCDLSCAIDLANRREPSSRRRRSLKKALKSGVQIDEGAHYATDLWSILEENLASKFGARPVHTLAEMTHLHALFEAQIKFVVALLDGKVIAGVVLFNTTTVAHAQYITSSGSGYEVSALDAVFDFCIEQAKTDGKCYFDFGTSNEDEGRKLNETLYNFKSEFGGGGIAHEFYEINLQEG
jgi:hypothetical protein